MVRILCVWSPSWAIANWRRRRRTASPAEAFALVATEHGVRRLQAVDAGAARLGLYPGQKATDATALVPDLVLAEAEPAADAAALEALADWCARFSPAVAPDPPDGLFLDISGAAHLWGGERAMAADLVARLGRNGIPARAAVAATPGAAWALARFAVGPEDPTLVCPPEGETAAVAGLPVAALRLASADTAQIGRLGLFSVGALAALPRAQITRRFGAAVVLRLDQMLGHAREGLVFRRPASPWLARRAFAEPISAPADLAQVAADLAADLCARLQDDGRAARRFEIAFHRLDGTAAELAVGLALPGRDPSALARLFAPRLEAVDPGFGIEVATLAAEGVERLSARQERLDADREVTPEEGVAPLVDRLANRLGETAVWRAEPYPSHDPERAVRRAAPLTPRPGPSGGWDPDRPRPVRLFRRPEPIEALAPVPDDPPVSFRWRGIAHRVRRAEGPERLAQEWWRRDFDEADPGRSRDYYRVEDEAGARFWLFRDGLFCGPTPPRWWLHGLFG